MRAAALGALLSLWACSDVDVIARRARPCVTPCTIAAGFPPLFALSESGGRLFFATFESGQVMSIAPDGSDLRVIGALPRYPFRLEPRGDVLLATAQEPSRLVEVPLDGGPTAETPLTARPFSSAPVDGGLVFSSYDGLFAVDLSTRTERPLLVIDGGAQFVTSSGAALAFSTGDSVFVLDEPSATPRLVSNAAAQTWDLTFDGDRVRWVEVDTGVVVVAQRDGGALGRLPTPVGRAHAAARFGDQLYVTGLTEKSVSRLDLVTGEATLVAQDEGDTLNIVATPAGVFWTNGAGQLRRLTP